MSGSIPSLARDETRGALFWLAAWSYCSKLLKPAEAKGFERLLGHL